MCGRTALTLRPEDVAKACAYRRRGETEASEPERRDEHNLGKSFNPSANIAPTKVTPVLLSESESDLRIIKPMMWGMVPPRHKGEPTKHGLSTNNCRLENVAKSKLYRSPLLRGNRCVVLAEGFYEWKTTDKSKQPYYIYPKPEKQTGTDPSNDEIGEKKLLKMAGLYDVWKCDRGNLLSYSIITMESNSVLDWLHHRMPAILETDEQLSKWLDVQNVSHEEALSFLKPASDITWHAVSDSVNNSRNKSDTCNKPVNSENINVKSPKTKNFGSANLMSAWLKRKPLTKDENSDRDSKKLRMDENK